MSPGEVSGLMFGVFAALILVRIPVSFALGLACIPVLILDALLEHKSGFDICREMRKSKRETPVILLGGRQGVEDKIEALQSGADDFLSKRNLVFEELMAKIDALLR